MSEDPGDEESSVQPALQETPQDADTASNSGLSGFSIGLSVDTNSDDDANSSLGDMDDAESSKSVTSSVYDFVEEFGRTYHKYKQGKYYLPNDEQEQSRLDLQHSLALRLLGGELNLAPINKPHRVLDVGTGTGIWAIEFAERHPESDVLGIDLSPIQPEYVPPNCRFEVDDADDEWVFSHPFDYIHGRYICAFLSDPNRFMANIFAALRPGGHVEIMETLMMMEAVDDSLRDQPLERWGQLVRDGLRRIGRDPMRLVHVKRWMAEAGFVNIVEKKIAVPSNPWARGREQKIRGALMMHNLLEVCQGITMNVLTKVWGWSPEEVEVFLADVRGGLKDRRIHAYVPVIVVWGEKPAT